MRSFYVYKLCRRPNSVLYVGMTSDLIKRVYEHRNNLVDGFRKKYNVHRLVWHEMHRTAGTAIQRDNQIKKWERAWKLRLIEEYNPEWKDLYDDLLEMSGFPPARERHPRRCERVSHTKARRAILPTPRGMPNYE